MKHRNRTFFSEQLSFLLSIGMTSSSSSEAAGASKKLAAADDSFPEKAVSEADMISAAFRKPDISPAEANPLNNWVKSLKQIFADFGIAACHFAHGT